jgi:hypothetical protein
VKHRSLKCPALLLFPTSLCCLQFSACTLCLIRTTDPPTSFFLKVIVTLCEVASILIWRPFLFYPTSCASTKGPPLWQPVHAFCIKDGQFKAEHSINGLLGLLQFSIPSSSTHQLCINRPIIVAARGVIRYALNRWPSRTNSTPPALQPTYYALIGLS